MVEQQTNLDNTPVFEQLWKITNELREKLDARFELHPNHATQELQSYSSLTGEAHGSLKTFSGSEINWMVHAWLRDSKTGFSNMHLTIWLGSQIRVPHLAYGFGTVPHLFCYMDYIPRSDLFTDLEYLDRYYEPVNKRYLELQADPCLKEFISKTLYMRQAQSRTSICFTSQITNETMTLVQTIAHEMMDRWLIWVDRAEPVAQEEQQALAARDLFIRRTIAERDPDNQLAIRLFGAEMTDKLIRALWAG
ncbi:red chlorophyll catabolite reductase [Pelatocladus sp. BLCC-F211]|uniref:red chlorophyll catabolite reductase n=1 Tax=Pelatocladus sp. BLCC-F211 TaxID=3342752 RepID=UPI0035B93BF4